MVEAMACGTPVIALKRGSVPEVVRDGITGFVVENLEEMCQATNWLDDIDPYACRGHVTENFSAGRMTDNYLAAYRQIMCSEGKKGSDGAPEPPSELIPLPQPRVPTNDLSHRQAQNAMRN
jgi:hypothetical protein